MEGVKKCELCSKDLVNDFTTLASQNYVETLEFLKGIKRENKKCNVCLNCFEKVNFVASFRARNSSAESSIKTTKEIYDSDEQELGDLCEFYAEQEDFDCDAKSSGSSYVEEDSKLPGNKDSKGKRTLEDPNGKKKKAAEFIIRCPQPDCKRIFARGSSSRKVKTHLKKFHNPATRDEVVRLYKFECQDCFALFKSHQTLNAHKALRHPDSCVKKVQCPHCNYEVLSSRRSELYRSHIRAVHPEFQAEVEEHQNKLKNRKSDLAIRAKIQCFLCSFAGVKISNMHRHYNLIHGYDKTLADKNSSIPDPEHPDGALCPECGEHFVNRHTLIKHLLKFHSKLTGEQCVYCNHRYVEVLEHIDRVHADEKSSAVQICKKCQPEVTTTSFEQLLSHTRTQHRKLNAEFESANSKEKRIKRIKIGSKADSSVKRSGSSQASKSSKKKYIPVHLSGICPFCEFKFADLLGHLRHNHDGEKVSEKKVCQLCGEHFGSIRELVSHRQLHPGFKSHSCPKCNAQFETVVLLRSHRKVCPKCKRKRKPVTTLPIVSSANPDTKSQTQIHASNSTIATTPAAIMTLMTMANDVDEMIDASDVQSKTKNVDFEGRGTVPCHLCLKTFTLKTLLRRHYISHHSYDPTQASEGSNIGNKSNESYSEPIISCQECELEFSNLHSQIRHQLETHSVISGQICPYCDSKWGWKKFDRLDDHVAKFHVLEMQSPIQTCSTCKTNFKSYDELKSHRQMHEGGNKKLTLLVSQESVSVHPMLGAKPEISNRGGVRCQLCNAFKLRKDHLKLHYIRHHGYVPKLALATRSDARDDDSQRQLSNVDLLDPVEGDDLIECCNCAAKFSNHHLMVKHLLKNHCSYTGLICPYCRGAFPQRFIDLQSHVTAKHMDQLTGYNVCNNCQVCSKSFAGYAEFRDHVQVHGDAYKEPSSSSHSNLEKKNSMQRHKSGNNKKTKI